VEVFAGKGGGIVKPLDPPVVTLDALDNGPLAGKGGG
jgi:hypothetical protein